MTNTQILHFVRAAAKLRERITDGMSYPAASDDTMNDWGQLEWEYFSITAPHLERLVDEGVLESV